MFIPATFLFRTAYPCLYVKKMPPEPPPRPGSVRFQGRDYKVVFDGNVDWLQARQAAIQAGGDLAIVDTKAKREFLFTHTGKTQLYVGAFRDSAGVWRWVDGRPVAAEAWAPGRPDNFGTYTVLFPNLGLGDGKAKITDSKGYIIEWPVPGSVVAPAPKPALDPKNMK